MTLINTGILLLAFMAGMLNCAAAQAAQQNWTIKGRIVADNVLPELADMSGNSSGVAGITVKVSARSRILTQWGTWNSWGKLTTDANGHFKVTESHGGDRRPFKVDILFDSPKLRIKEGQESDIVTLNKQGFPINVNIDLTAKDWHEVHNDKNGAASSGRKAGVIDLGDIELTRKVVREHANIWALYDKVFDLFGEYGPAYAFQKKVSVKYPMRLGSISYANPLNNTIYIDGGELDSGTLIHELMHIREYERVTGEDNMAWQAIQHGSTHQPRENTTFVPAMEGFAEWATYEILKEISDGKVLNFDNPTYEYPDFPLSRAHIVSLLLPSEQSVANVDFTESGVRLCQPVPDNILSRRAIGLLVEGCHEHIRQVSE